MSDRELLELAAKAAGRCAHTEVVGEEWEDGNDAGTDWKCKACGSSPDYWNPLTDDGDALRLAVKLQVDIHIPQSVSQVYAQAGECPNSILVAINGDPYAATRRAIVSAAAEIGRLT